MIIYKITNLVNGKIYIGQTIHSLAHRKYQHLKCARNGIDRHLYRAIRKYGENNFKFEIIAKANSLDDLNYLESYYIIKYDSVRSGYNMSYGGDNNVMFSDIVYNKHKARMQSEETRKNISDGMKKYRAEHPFTDEHRQKLSKAAMGNHNFGNGDTRSIGCYCVTDTNNILHFHSYRDAWKWWKEQDNPFNTQTECVFQRKIKQSIELGYYTYGHSNAHYEYPKWFREERDVNEAVADKI